MNNLNRQRLLLADNLPEYRQSLRGFLELEGYEFAEAGSPEEAIEKIEKEEFDLVLADLRMRVDGDPYDIGGIEIAKFASEHGIPCVIVTAFQSIELARIALRARGGEAYAQDLVTKASGAQAVLDSIRPILQARSSKREKPIKNRLIIDLKKRLVWKDDELIKLSKNQYSLMEELHKKAGGVCSYKELIKAIYDEDLTPTEAQNDKRFRHLVERTKEKIEDKDSGHEYIEAVPGRGYRLNLKN